MTIQTPSRFIVALHEWLRPWRLCLILGMLGAVPLVFLTPPFQVPDEHQHFFRAYQLSEGRARSIVVDGKAGAVLPSSLPEVAAQFLGSLAFHIARPPKAQPLAAERGASFHRPLDPDRREFVDFTGAAFYSPLPYLPQAAAIGFGRAIGAGPLVLFYMARLANAIATVSMLAWALRLMPTGQRVGLLLALLPIAIFVYGSLSPDSLLIAAAFLFTALMARGCLRGRWTAGEVVTSIASGLVFCSLKPVYAPLLLLGLPAALRRGSTSHALAVLALVCSITLGATALWLSYTSSALVLQKPGTDISGQIAFIAGDPGGYARVVYWTILRRWHEYREQLVGVLGWLNIRLPAFAYVLPLVGLLFCIPTSCGKAQRLPLIAVPWIAVLVGSSALLVMTALYLYWTPVGDDDVVGVQGRYFLPLMAPLAVAFGSMVRFRTSPRADGYAMLGLALVIAILVLTTQVTIVSTFARLG